MTWKYRVPDNVGVDLNSPPADLDSLIDRSRVFHEWSLAEAHLRRVNYEGKDDACFPALSVPLGPDDELTCPQEHQEFVAERMSSADAIDLLVIGYSAYDRAVLDLLRAADTEVRSLWAIGGDPDIAHGVIQRIGDAIGMNADSPAVGLHGGFREWVESGLARYPEWVRSR